MHTIYVICIFYILIICYNQCCGFRSEFCSAPAPGKKFGSGTTYKTSAPTGSSSKKTDLDTKDLKSQNFNFKKASMIQGCRSRFCGLAPAPTPTPILLLIFYFNGTPSMTMTMGRGRGRGTGWSRSRSRSQPELFWSWSRSWKFQKMDGSGNPAIILDFVPQTKKTYKK